MATFTNQARLTYTGGSAASNITVGELVQVLTAAKTAVVPTYRRDGAVTYLITLTNTGTTPLTGLTVTDDLGGYAFGTGTLYPLAYTAGSVRYYQNGVLQAAPTVTAGPPLTVTGITVPAGGDVTLAYEATPTEFAPLAAESTVVNTAAVTGGGLADPVTATETVSPLAAPSSPSPRPSPPPPSRRTANSPTPSPFRTAAAPRRTHRPTWSSPTPSIPASAA